MFQMLFALFNGLSTGVAIFLVAAGLTLVFGALKVVNFAHGAFFMVGAYVTFSVVGPGVPGMWELLGGALIAAAVVGLLGWVTDLAIWYKGAFPEVGASQNLVARFQTETGATEPSGIVSLGDTAIRTFAAAHARPAVRDMTLAARAFRPRRPPPRPAAVPLGGRRNAARIGA